MNNRERTKQRALVEGRRDALSGRTPHSLAKDGSMWGKYYRIGYDEITIDQRAQTVQAGRPKIK